MSYNNFENTSNKIEKIYNVNKETKTKIDNFKVKSYDVDIKELKYNQKLWEEVYGVDDYGQLYREKIEVNFRNISDNIKTQLKIVNILEYKHGYLETTDIISTLDYWWEEDKLCFTFNSYGFVGTYENYQIRIIIYYIK